MGRWYPKSHEDELVRKVKYLFELTNEKLSREQSLPAFEFEDFIDCWDENDKFILRLFEFFIKETAIRHYVKTSVNESDEFTSLISGTPSDSMHGYQPDSNLSRTTRMGSDMLPNNSRITRAARNRAAHAQSLQIFTREMNSNSGALNQNRRTDPLLNRQSNIQPNITPIPQTNSQNIITPQRFNTSNNWAAEIATAIEVGNLPLFTRLSDESSRMRPDQPRDLVGANSQSLGRDLISTFSIPSHVITEMRNSQLSPEDQLIGQIYGGAIEHPRLNNFSMFSDQRLQPQRNTSSANSARVHSHRRASENTNLSRTIYRLRRGLGLPLSRPYE